MTAEPDALWRLFFNTLPASEAPQALAVDGTPELVVRLVHARSVTV